MGFEADLISEGARTEVALPIRVVALFLSGTLAPIPSTHHLQIGLARVRLLLPETLSFAHMIKETRPPCPGTSVGIDPDGTEPRHCGQCIVPPVKTRQASASNSPHPPPSKGLRTCAPS